jgi:hypothetical protein
MFAEKHLLLPGIKEFIVDERRQFKVSVLNQPFLGALFDNLSKC